ncbi:MAG: RlmE family RNA methyltransferase [Rhodospirillaceae bacterium]|nr:RlmE family RNA methyltransferase [Rhodospirillaceae bacterium]
MKSSKSKGGDKKKGSSGRSMESRGAKVQVKTARGRTVSSQRWLQRQLNDPYVHRAKAEGYRSRAAYKLIELDDKFHFLKPGQKVVDLGAAPGGWTQVAVQRVKPEKTKGLVVGIDINPWDAVPGATCLTMDFTLDKAPEVLKNALGGSKADVVLSDMAAPATGHPGTDHLRIMALAELAWAFAEEVLAPGGVFVCKVFQGGTEGELLKQIKTKCAAAKHAKPAASRKDSAEIYLLATGFKG